MGLRKYNLLFVCCLLSGSLSLVGCSGVVDTRERDVVDFSGDVAPLVTSTQAFGGQLDNLAPNESLIVARARDGSGALSQPEKARLIVVEPVLEEQLHDPGLWLERCDVDGDGVLDRYCPDLFSALSDGDTLETQRFVSIRSWYQISLDSSVDRDYWGQVQTLNTGNVKKQEIPVTLKLLAINMGNKTFQGDLDIYVNIPPKVRLGDIQLASKVASREGAKEAVNVGLAVLGAAVGAYVAPNSADTFLDDYANIESEAQFQFEELKENRAHVHVSNIALKPTQGVTLEYDSLYTVSD